MNLLEALIVLCIISLIAVIALPSWQPFYHRETDKALQSQLIRAIEFARHESQARHTQIGLCSSKDLKTCSGTWTDGMLVFIDDNSNPSKILSIIQENAINGILYLRSYPAYLSYLQFLPEGFTRSSNNGTFWYCHAEAIQPSWAITLNQSGETHVLCPDKNGEIKDSQGKPLTC